MQTLLTACCWLLSASTLALPLRAQPGPAALEEARSLFADATALEAQGDYRAAAKKLERALAIKETPGLRYHLAHCEEQLGALVAAGNDYDRAAELIRAGASAPDVEPLLPLAADRLASRVARLEIVVPAGARASAELDGVALPDSAFGAPVKVDPGAHRLLVRSPGQPDFSADLSFASGERRTIKVFVEATPPPRDSSPVAPPPSHRSEQSGLGGRGVVLLSEAALTLTGLGLGVGFLVARGNAAERVGHAQSAVDAASPGTNGCGGQPALAACTDLEQALDEHSRASTLATVSFVGAGVAASALVMTWALWPSSSRATSLALHPRAAGIELTARAWF
ncbi:MAG TPA: hypothetical protein VFV94_20445 [Polyangiaceae bacterium]|nr:hypothetical protein [Polyangiaceae bacterium]